MPAGRYAKMRGFQTKHFSFNVDGGRCDTCKGEGEQVVEMQFLADVHLTCEICGGKRFKEEILEVQYNGKNIYDVLDMSVDDAIDFFKEEKTLAKALQPLQDVGLGYIKLGQSSDTLSGGEAQRVKLASFLGKGKAAGKVLFIFDEPTTGLHFHDISKLLSSFYALIEHGHSLIVIEHNTDVIKNCRLADRFRPRSRRCRRQPDVCRYSGRHNRGSRKLYRKVYGIKKTAYTTHRFKRAYSFN